MFETIFRQNFKNLSIHQIQSNFLTMIITLNKMFKKQNSLIRDTKKNVIIDNSIEHSNKNIYFRNVHFYIKKIKNMILFKNVDVIRTKFYNCIRNYVLR